MNFTPHPNQKIATLVGIFLVAVIGIGAYFSLRAITRSDSSTPAPIIVHTGRKTYTNTKYGYTLTYKADDVLFDTTATGAVVSPGSESLTILPAGSSQTDAYGDKRLINLSHLTTDADLSSAAGTEAFLTAATVSGPGGTPVLQTVTPIHKGNLILYQDNTDSYTTTHYYFRTSQNNDYVLVVLKNNTEATAIFNSLSFTANNQ